jgi:hypothetical protein
MRERKRRGRRGVIDGAGGAGESGQSRRDQDAGVSDGNWGMNLNIHIPQSAKCRREREFLI